MGLHDYIMSKKPGYIEGYSQQIPDQVKDLSFLISSENIKNVIWFVYI